MSFINRVTEIPGPKSREILQRRAKAVSGAVAKSTDIVTARAEGALVTDVDGNTLIDLAGGIGMLAAGHCPPAVVNAMKEQAEELIHTCFLVSTFEPYVELCELLNEVAPIAGDAKTILANSGAEAVENAIKMARAYTKRPAVVVFEGAYHGRTLLTMSMTSKYSLFKRGFGPFASEIYRLPVPNLYRKPKNMGEAEYVDWCCQQLENALVSQVEPDAIAAIVIEPVQGEAGFNPVPCTFLQKIRDICDEHGIVMVADEIQCGMGRTGRLFAIEHYDITPDIITMGKSLGSGMPISATTGRAEVMDSPHIGGAGGTYGGAPLAARAAIESVKMIRDPQFLARVQEVGTRMRDRLMAWEERFDLIGDVRGLGSMLLFELVKDRETKEPAPDETLKIIKHAVAEGLLLIRAGLYSNCVRLLPPLVITDEQIDEAFDVLESAIDAVQNPVKHKSAAAVGK